MIHSEKIQKQKRAYELTFSIENMLRVSMHNMMVKKVGLNYFTEATFPEYEYDRNQEQNRINVVQFAKQRRGAEKTYNIALGYDYPDFWYLDFRILISLIDIFWDRYFRGVFKEANMKKRNEIVTRLKSTLQVRNAVAHHRYVSNVDVGDLESVLKVLKASLSKDYLYNFEDLALNSFERLVQSFLETCKDVKSQIEMGLIIQTSKVDQLKSSFSAVYSIAKINLGINEFEALVALIRKYNRLPRKPGRGDEILTFKKSNQIEDRLDFVMKIVEEFI